MRNWYFLSFKQEFGPLTLEELQDCAIRGEISPADQVRWGPEGNWRQVSSIDGLLINIPKDQSATAKLESLPRPKAGSVTDKKTVNSATMPVQASPNKVPVEPVQSTNGAQGTINGTSAETASVDNSDWHVLINGFLYGPLPMGQLLQMAESGNISMFDYVKDGPNSPWITIHALCHYGRKQPSSSQANTSTDSKQDAPAITPVPLVVTPIPTPPANAASSPTITAPKSVGTEAPVAVQPPGAPVPTPEAKSPPASERPAMGFEPTSRTDFKPLPPMAAKLPKPIPATKNVPKSRSAPRSPSFNLADFDFQALTADKPKLYAASLIAVILFVGAGMFFMLERTGPVIVLYKELAALHQEIQQRASTMKDIKELNPFSKPVLVESTKISQELVNSRHPAKADLTDAVASMKAALGSRQTTEARTELNTAGDKLNSAKKLLKL